MLRERRPAILALAILALRHPGSAQESAPERAGLALTPLLAPRVTGRFEALDPKASGVRFRNDYHWDDRRRHLFEHAFAGGGVAIGDVDGDERPELYLTSQTGRDVLFHQVDRLVFEDATQAAGLDLEPEWSSGAAFADVDGDGDLDLHVCHYDAPNRMHVNDGSGHFIEEAAARGVAVRAASVQASFADYDRDGDLDFYLVTNRFYPGPGLDVPRTEQVDGRVRLAPGQEDSFELLEVERLGGPQGSVTEKYVGKAGQPDRLFRNRGDGFFEDVSRAAGVLDHGPGLSALWWDPDGDLWPDLYVASDYFAPDRWYENARDGTFAERLGERVPHTPWFSMGTASADLDGDGRPELWVADMAPTTHYQSKIMMGDMNDSRWFLESAEPRQYMRNALFRNTGTPRFMEVAALAHLASTDWTWSVKLGDLDNDGLVDAFVTNGTANNSFDPDLTRAVMALGQRLASEGRSADEVREAEWQLYRSKPPRAERNLAFHNAGDLDFHEVGRDWGLGDEVVAYGAALADLDRDGDLDLVVSPIGAPTAVYENGFGGGRDLVRLVGRASARAGTGATLVGRTATRTLARHLAPESGYLASDEALVHFGLGEESLTSLEVRWPSGHVQRFGDLPPGHLLTITEPEGPAPPAAIEEARPGRLDGRFEQRFLARLAGPVAPPERPFDDYAREPLLPMRLSKPGPGLALADVDGDGNDDLFLGGSSGVAGALWMGRGDGTFVECDGPWRADAASEDTAILFLDPDGDGDLDLLVASGSTECEPGAAVLRDRFYRNEGGRFVADPGALPAGPGAFDNTSALCTADIDADGDLDVFVGARSVPGRYPETPRSRLLVNEGGHFVDATAARAPALERVGLVTSALWTDVEGDGDPDLFVACEWGPVALFRNTAGALEDVTAVAGLAERTGWWNGIAAADLDGDGDLDLVATNAGWNTKYKASPAKPAALYYGDVAGEGHASLVEAKVGETLLPVRGLSCSSEAMPSIRERLPTYDAFARAGLLDIYAPERLESALHLEATELASGVLFNESTAERPAFRWQAFERLVQAAPGQSPVLADLDGDGDVDVFLAQNAFQREPETGRWDGGLGALLDNDGHGAFTWVEACESGIVVPESATAAVAGDADGDGRPDLLVAVNEGPLRLFLNASRRPFVAIEGRSPASVGARLTLETAAGRGPLHELGLGSGVLSSATPRAFLARPPGPSTLHVRWPDGRETRRELTEPAARVVLEGRR